MRAGGKETSRPKAMTREELRALMLRWCVARGYQPRPQHESRCYGGTFFAKMVGLRSWDVSNVVRGDWAWVKKMRTPVKIADTLGLALCEVWPAEAGALPGLRGVPDPPYLVRPCTVGLGFDIPAPLPPIDIMHELREKLAFLPERQQLVLSMHFGLDGPEMPLDSLGVILGCSRERVRQIEAQALQRLRALLGAPVPEPADPRAHSAPWRGGRTDRHCARSSRESQAVELERALEHVRTEGRPAPAGTARRIAGRSSTECGRARIGHRSAEAEPREPASVAAGQNRGQQVAMPAAGAPQTIRSRIEPFTSELTDLVTRSVLSQEQEALGPSPARPASDAGHGEKLGAGTRRTSTAPISFERYERMAIEHALEECSGAALAAAGLLGVGKSTLYRQMRRLRVGRSSSGHKAQDAIRLDGPPSLAAYERLALEHALAETGGDKFAAAKLLHVGKSTLYRKLARHGLG